MKTLITGSSGFIARALAAHQRAAGENVLGIGRTRPPGSGAFERVELGDFAALLACLERFQPDTVYHLAAHSVLQLTADSGARMMLEANVGGTWNLLEACRRVGVPVVVVASSDKQYGAFAPPPYDDQDTTAFRNGGLYELSKAQQDQVARLYAGLYAVPAVRVARLPNVYGPGDRNWSRLIPGTIRKSFEQSRPRLTAGLAGMALREYLFIDDLLPALTALATDAAQRGNAPLRVEEGKLAQVGFNLGSPHRHSAGEVIRILQSMLADEFGIQGLTPEVLPGAPGVFEPGSQFSDCSRFLELFPEHAPRDLVSGLRATIPWYREELKKEEDRPGGTVL